MVITRKIQLIPLGDTKEERNAVWAAVRKLSKDVFRAANLVTNHQFFNELLVERMQKTDPELAHRSKKLDGDIEKLTAEMKDCKDETEKTKLAEKRKKLYAQQNMLTREAREKAVELFCTSEANTTYQELGKHFPDMPSQVQSALNMEVVKAFRASIFDVKRGERALQTFRDGMPIPFDKVAMRFVAQEGDITMNWIKGMSFHMNFGRDKSGNRLIVERAIAGEYKYSNSKIQISDSKIFLLFVVEIPDKKTVLDPDTIVGVNLGIAVPAYCSVNNGKDRLAIGDINDLFRTRQQFQARYKSLQKQLAIATGGHGRKKKLKPLEALEAKEKNFAKTYNHQVSNAIVKFAIKNSAGTIVMELLEGYGAHMPDSIILRNWSYFQLHQFVEYKAKAVGIAVKYSDPHLISQTCCECGEYHEDNLNVAKREFMCHNPLCKNFEVKVFTDYNASQNNCRHPRYVESKKDCVINGMHLEVA